MTTTPEGRAKSLGENLFEAVMANTPGEDRTTWVMVSPDVQSHFEGTALTFAASLTHDETANAVIASLTARAEASEQREAGLIDLLKLSERELSCSECDGHGAITTGEGELDECPACHGNVPQSLAKIRAALTTKSGEA